MMKKLKPKPCPFCFENSYYYKTTNGLFRHVLNNHLCDNKGRRVVYFGKAEQLIKETKIGPLAIPIENWEEVKEFLLDYFADFNNPSKRSSRLWKYVNS